MTKNYVITIGRQLGAGGAVLGRAIAEHFGFQYIDKEFVVLAGQHLHVALDDMGEFEKPEKKPYWMKMANTDMKALPYIGDSWVKPTSKQLFEEQTNIMKEAVENGPCVIIGRCGSQIFEEYENHISIFLHGDIESRAKRLANILGKELDPDKDYKQIEKTDKERAKYYRTYAGYEWDSMKQYDLVLDTSKMTDEQIRDVVIGYIGTRYPDLKK